MHVENLENENKQNQWMGVTVQSQGPGGKILVRERECVCVCVCACVCMLKLWMHLYKVIASTNRYMVQNIKMIHYLIYMSKIKQCCQID